MAETVFCKHATRLYEQDPGSGNWFHAAKCIEQFCLPVAFDPVNFNYNSGIEEVDGYFIEWFGNGTTRDVAGLETCHKCGHGFEDVEDLFSPQDPVEFWKHNTCPGGDI
jgi:hypothetical protein